VTVRPSYSQNCQVTVSFIHNVMHRLWIVAERSSLGEVGHATITWLIPGGVGPFAQRSGQSGRQQAERSTTGWPAQLDQDRWHARLAQDGQRHAVRAAIRDPQNARHDLLYQFGQQTASL